MTCGGEDRALGARVSRLFSSGILEEPKARAPSRRSQAHPLCRFFCGKAARGVIIVDETIIETGGA